MGRRTGLGIRGAMGLTLAVLLALGVGQLQEPLGPQPPVSLSAKMAGEGGVEEGPTEEPALAVESLPAALAEEPVNLLELSYFQPGTDLELLASFFPVLVAVVLVAVTSLLVSRRALGIRRERVRPSEETAA